MWVTGDYTGQSNKTILYQGFNTDYIPSGTRVTFSGYMLNPSTDPIQNINQAYISIDQFATSGSIGNTPSWIINHTSESITSNHEVDDWYYFEVSSVTEENTRFLQMRINYEQFNDDSGTVFIDNLMITTSNTHLILHDVTDIDKWWDGEKFDRILIDAPCSATGIIRRQPDIKILRTIDEIKTIVMSIFKSQKNDK